MKEILIIAEFVGKEETEQNDAKIVDFVRAAVDTSEIHFYSKQFILNKHGEYIRTKGVKIHSPEDLSMMPMEYDKIVATDSWAKTVARQFKVRNAEQPSAPEKPMSQVMQEQTEKEERMESEAIDLNYDSTTKKIADIIIPHHNRHDLLKHLLSMIPNDIFNIHIISGKSFGRNCNKGAKISETKNLIFLNDDIEITAEQLIKMVNTLKKYDFVGTTQLAGADQRKYWGIKIFQDEKGQLRHGISDLEKDSIFPSGFCFAITKAAWEKMKGFNEKYSTGNEDIDFGLRAIDKKLKMTILDLEIPHMESQSLGRFNFVEENEDLFYKTWGDKLEKYANIPSLSDDDFPIG